MWWGGHWDDSVLEGCCMYNGISISFGILCSILQGIVEMCKVFVEIL